jgi:hypothetical protein
VTLSNQQAPTGQAPTGQAPAADGLTREILALAAVVVLGSIMTILDATIVKVALPTLGRDLHASISTIQWVPRGDDPSGPPAVLPRGNEPPWPPAVLPRREA